MKLLDRYIIRQFLVNFAILVFVLMALFVLIDLILDLDEFLAAGEIQARRWNAARFAAQQGVDPATLSLTSGQFDPSLPLKFLGILYMVGDFYGPIMLLLYVYFSGLLVVGAMGFTLSGLHRSRELVAMVTGGISMYRIAAPLVIAGFLLSSLALPVQEFLVPDLTHKLTRGKSELKQKAVRTDPVYFSTDEAGNLMSAASFEPDPPGPMLEGLTILERDAQGRAIRRITAQQGFWDATRGGWDLTQGYAIRAALDPGANPEPGRRAPLMEEIDFYRTTITPDVLRARQAALYLRLMSLGDLARMLANPSADAQQIVQIMHGRFSLLVMNVLILVMGLPFFLLREPSNLLLQGAKTAGVCMTAWAMGLVLLQATGGPLNPVATAWLPVVLYLPLSAALLQMVKT